MDLTEALLECEIELSEAEAIIHCPNSEMAGEVWKQQHLINDQLPEFKGIRWVRITMQGRELLPGFPVRSSLLGFNKTLVLPADAQYEAVLDFMCNSSAPVCVTNHLTHTCLLLNNLFAPERIIWKPSQYMGLNFLYYWRDSMQDLEYLMRELRLHGKLENFRYQMRRVDNSLAYYVMDYKLIEDFLGAPARVSVSHEWGVIEPAPISS